MTIRIITNLYSIFLNSIILFLDLTGCSTQKADKPILLLQHQADFGLYTKEILRAEGLNEFNIDSLESGHINGSFLAGFELVVLSEKISDKYSWKLLQNYVEKGGKLISVIPSGYPENIFGIVKDGTDSCPDYLGIDTTSVEGKSLTGCRIQVHSHKNAYKPVSARNIAWFRDTATGSDKHPAVIAARLGKGETVAFLYNLPENIVLTRQGNPEFAGMEKDGIPGLRPMDLFTDGWVDTSCNSINQADQQMYLLSHCIRSMCGSEKPLPSLWYFPDTLKCIVTLTNDGESRGENDFEKQFRDIDSVGAKMSLYVLETGKVSRSWAEKWTAAGFEIAGHPDDTWEAVTPVWKHMDSIVAGKVSDLSSLYGLKMKTVVNHWFVWCGIDENGRPEFAEQAVIEADHGMSADANYAHYDNHSTQGHFLGQPGTAQGNYTGSGLPMRFCSSAGKVIDIYQHLNNVYDQQYNENHDPDGFFNCFKGLMDRSIDQQFYSFISIKSHNDEYYFSRDPLLKMISYAGERKIPVWTVAMADNFVRARDEAQFTRVRWSGNDLAFDLQSSVSSESVITFMLPCHSGAKNLSSIEIDGKIVNFKRETVKGTDYAFCSILPGKNYAIAAHYKN